MKLEVQYNQQLIDIVMQQYGSADKIMQLASALNISITDYLNAGDRLDVPGVELSATEKSISKQLQQKINIPGSGDADIPEQELAGLEIWALELDFIIS